jgi:hypothetical protein
MSEHYPVTAFQVVEIPGKDQWGDDVSLYTVVHVKCLVVGGLTY